MRNKMEQTPNADTFTFISGMGAIISIIDLQSYISIGAGMVAIVSGLCAIRYYIIKSKK